MVKCELCVCEAVSIQWSHVKMFALNMAQKSVSCCRLPNILYIRMHKYIVTRIHWTNGHRFMQYYRRIECALRRAFYIKPAAASAISCYESRKVEWEMVPVQWKKSLWHTSSIISFFFTLQCSVRISCDEDEKKRHSLPIKVIKRSKRRTKQLDLAVFFSILIHSTQKNTHTLSCKI